MHNNFYDYKKYAILYVDDETMSLKMMSQAFEDKFWVLTAPSAAEGFKLLEKHKDEIGILITDQRMPHETGVQLLEKAKQLRPKIVRILATAYSDFEAAIAAVNSGAIYKYVSKPWDVQELEITLKRALEFFIVQRERDQLLREKLSVLHNIMITDRVVSLGVLAAGLNHHMRNSLQAIRTFLDLAPNKLSEENVNMEDLRNPDFWNEFYGHVLSQVRKITQMLSDISVASNTEGETLKHQLNLKEFLASVVEKMKDKFAEKKIELRLNVADDLPPLYVDRANFTRLFELLLQDELVSLPEGSLISLNARLQPAAETLLPEVQIDMEDNGPGLPEAQLRSIFDPFFVRSDHPQEFGINLMASFFIVYHHGGRIDASNKEEGGLRIRLNFPTHQEVPSDSQNETDFLYRVFLNEVLWEKILADK